MKLISGGAKVVLPYLAKGIPVTFICKNSLEINRIWFNAVDLFQGYIAVRPFKPSYIIRLKNNSYFKLITVDYHSVQKTSESLLGYRGVVIHDPEFHFPKNSRELKRRIDYCNTRHQTNEKT